MNALKKISTAATAQSPWGVMKGRASEGRRWTADFPFLQVQSEAEADGYEAFVERLGRYMIAAPSPFDAIYLSRLRPDVVAAVDIALLYRYASITDLSDELGFDDGMD